LGALEHVDRDLEQGVLEPIGCVHGRFGRLV